MQGPPAQTSPTARRQDPDPSVVQARLITQLLAASVISGVAASWGVMHPQATALHGVPDKVIETVDYGRTRQRQAAPRSDGVLLSHAGHGGVSLYRHGETETGC
ncbi:MAG: hypothetical protein ACREX4_05720 [Gammaproteobacteria bacterium]